MVVINLCHEKVATIECIDGFLWLFCCKVSVLWVTLTTKPPSRCGRLTATWGSGSTAPCMSICEKSATSRYVCFCALLPTWMHPIISFIKHVKWKDQKLNGYRSPSCGSATIFYLNNCVWNHIVQCRAWWHCVFFITFGNLLPTTLSVWARIWEKVFMWNVLFWNCSTMAAWCAAVAA